MADVKPTPRAMKWIRERVANDLCLEPGCECKISRKGLCSKHYNRQYYDAMRMSPIQRQKFFSRLQRIGRMLGAYTIRLLRREDSFAKAAREI